MSSRTAFSAAFVLCIVGCQATRLASGQALHAVIDREVTRHAGGVLSPLADDAEFLRRVYFDFAGKPPTADEARNFLHDSETHKRQKLIDQLLAGADYPRRMQEVFTSMLLERRTDAKVPDAEWEMYLGDSFSANKPWDKLVGELLFSEPGADKKLKPPSKFFLVSGRADMHQKTQDVARLFLGRDIMCAQCHNHPTVDDYLQGDYFGLFSYLQDAPEKANSEFESVFVAGKKTTGPKLPEGKVVSIPKFEKGQEDEAKKYRPRLLLSSDLPNADNQLFVRTSVNRFWYLMMGRGLVHPLHLDHSRNPPSHPELLDAMSAEFAKSGFDVKQLLREIALSNAYQRSSRLPEGVESKDVAPESYRTAIGKPLTPEQMGWAVMQATGNLESMLKAPATESSEFTYKDYINGRIDEAPDNFADAMKLFVGVFGNPPGEPEVTFNPAMGHALFLMNEQMVLNWLKPKPDNLVDRLSKMSDNAKIADELYLNVLTRLPTVDERANIAAFVDRFKNRRNEALGDLAWALIVSDEFRMNH